MHKRVHLQQLAIQAAKDGNWTDAVTYNTALLEIEPTDVSAHNRLGISYLQLDQKKKAVASFKQSLEIDASNTIARKHLDKLKNNETINPPTFSEGQFIEEPGKTKTVELHRLAGKDVLSAVRVGTACTLVPKNRFISIEIDGTYVGALPEDLSYRLTKLINSGNEYNSWIRSVDSTVCSIFIKELTRSKKNEHINSFPLVASQLTTINDIDETFLDDEVPVQIVMTDSDGEPTTDFTPEDLEENDNEPDDSHDDHDSSEE